MKLVRAGLVALAAFIVGISTSGDAQTSILTLSTPNPQSNASFGFSVAMGDVNGDGKADIAVGTFAEDVGSNENQGRAYVFSGADGSLLYPLNSLDPQAHGHFGVSVAMGDANGDGKADIAVGAFWEDVSGNIDQGRAYVFSGAGGSPLFTLNTPNPQPADLPRFGNSVAMGDVNGDGKADIAVGVEEEDVGANLNQGRVYVFSGANGALLRTLNTPNPRSNAKFGASVAVGDVNGDGRADIVVGELAGHVYVFSGMSGTRLFTFDVPAPEDYTFLGVPVAVGDVNGDGKGDIAVGSYDQDVGGNVEQGRAYVFSGANGSLLFALDTPNPESYASFGVSIAVGDINDDGMGDVGVGAWLEDASGNSGQGRAYVFSGATGSALFALETPNPQTAAFLGYSIAMGDANGDGHRDIAVGASGEDAGGYYDQGRAYVFSLPSFGSTSRVSVDSAGAQANDWSDFPVSMSADGRYVAFTSYASNLVPADTNGQPDIFIHDLQTLTTERVSVDNAGIQGNDWSRDQTVSADGRFVAFYSVASNLVPGDTNGTGDVFVRDRQMRTTQRVSLDSAGDQANGWSVLPDISGDGRYVAFASDANLTPNDDNGREDIFVRDRWTGATELVSVDSAEGQANDLSSEPSISDDGRYIAFLSPATDLVPGDTNSSDDIFVRDRLTGTTERVSVDSDGNEANSWSSYPPAISGDGRYVAFTSDASNLIPGDTNDAWDVFVRDRQAEATFRVSVSSSGNQANDYSVDPAISSNGRYVAFHSGATNLVIGDTNAAADVFVHDRHTGEIIRMSVDGSGNQANDFSANPAISGDSHYVAFYSGASNLVPEDTNSLQDIFVHDAGDSDDDAEWNPFDPNPNDPDCDDDAFDDGIEIYLGSDPLDACRDFPGMPGLCPGPSCNGDDAWPLDVNVDGQVSITGDVLNFVGRIGLTSGAPNWLQRLDFNGDGQISIVGDVFLYRGRIGETCT